MRFILAITIAIGFCLWTIAWFLAQPFMLLGILITKIVEKIEGERE